MTEITFKKTHELLEKLAEYVMNEVVTKRDFDKDFEQVDKHFEQLEENVKETKEDVRLILEGMDAQVKQKAILKIEQIETKSGLKRLEKRVDNLEKKTS